MTRFQKVAAASVATTFALVVIGVIVRSTNSGVACPTWPGCFPGQFLPGADAGANVWFEWVHRTVAVLVGLLVLGMALLAVLDHRDRRSCGRVSRPWRSWASRPGWGARPSASGTPGSR